MNARLPAPAKTPETQSKLINSAGTTNASQHWFINSVNAPFFLARQGCEIEVYTNSADAFSAVCDAISAAKKTVDYVTWGFDPMMRMKNSKDTIGDLLLKKAGQDNVHVRLLLWYDKQKTAGSYTFGSDVDGGAGVDGQPFNTFNLPGYGAAKQGEPDKYPDRVQWYQRANLNPRITLTTRAMDGAEAGAMASAAGLVLNKNQGANAPDQSAALAKATHHQKMILIDYVQPDRAVGFVMGSNTLQRYWDDKEHQIEHPNRRMDFTVPAVDPLAFEGSTLTTDPRTASYGVEGAYSLTGAPSASVQSVPLQPWQDVSAKVRGGVLYDLNANFQRAWERENGKLEAERAALKPEAFMLKGSSQPLQIVRTQPQERHDTGIWTAYTQNVLNARKYIYFENQYFRLPDLISHIDKAADALKNAGYPNNLYLFAVTNVPGDDLTSGLKIFLKGKSSSRFNTYRMMRLLGLQEQLPKMNVKEVNDLTKKPLPNTQGGDKARLQAVVCTLTACQAENQRYRYLPIYVHSKLMIQDDVFFTLGSANLNARSMVGDSELNVLAPAPAKAKALRETLWSNYRQTTLETEWDEEFRKWKKVAQANLEFIGGKKDMPLNGRLTLFHDPGAKTTVGYD